MDADLDWCLTCERRLDGPEPYCSDVCKANARRTAYVYVPDDDDADTHHVLVHDTQLNALHKWRSMPTDDAAIAAWAADIPYGAPPADPEPAPSPSTSACGSPTTPGSFRAPPPPNLVKTPRRAVPPTLSMSTPQRPVPQPSTPVLTPRRYPSSASMAPSGYASMGQTSLCTAATGSSLALSTPPLSHPVPIVSSGSRQAPAPAPNDEHVVRSWVSPSPAALAAATARHYPHLQHILVNDAAATLQKSASRKHLPAMLEPIAGSWQTENVFIAQPFEKLPRVHTFRGDEHPSFRTRGRKESRAAA